jgi:UDP-N-acetylglucosamine--N-acetylmuramyl-(pentapeptide) pyrophosphoryl-undecaprenol N-acetylglucosamine transferase
MLDDARAAYRDAGVEASVEPFIADMAAAYAWADLVVCRAGALTLAEVCAVGVASLLVPFPQAVDDHQTKNAQYLVERGAAKLLPQSETLPARLADCLTALGSRDALRPMAEAARALAKPDAAARVADLVMQEIALQNPTPERAA